MGKAGSRLYPTNIIISFVTVVYGWLFLNQVLPHTQHHLTEICLFYLFSLFSVCRNPLHFSCSYPSKQDVHYVFQIGFSDDNMLLLGLHFKIHITNYKLMFSTQHCVNPFIIYIGLLLQLETTTKWKNNCLPHVWVSCWTSRMKVYVCYLKYAWGIAWKSDNLVIIFPVHHVLF